MAFTIRAPQTEEEWQAYYHFRWQQLRAPWQQPEGSEKDELESSAWHCFIVNESSEVIACGRLHKIDDRSAQIRYMAVATEQRLHGLGKAILDKLESLAIENALSHIVLHARESAIDFYARHGYSQHASSHTLYGVIKHVQMDKQLVG